LKRLVIKKGNEIQRREIGATSLTVGRDPSCEIHVDDPSLSRRHGMFEPTPGGVRFVDLGSRNGSWVNFQKTKEAELKPGDTVRMGSILITYTCDPPPPPPPAKSEVAADDSATVLLSPKPAPKPTAPAAKADSDPTVLLAREAPKSPPLATQLLRSEAPPKSKAPDTARLAIAAPPPAAPPATPAPAGVEPEVSIDDTPPRGSWTGRHALMVLGVALTVYLVLALPLVRTLGNALREESLRRGRALLDLLTAANGTAVAEGRAKDLEVAIATREERVKEAFLLDLQGKVLAPSGRAGEKLATIDGIGPPLEEIRTFYLGRRRNGDYVMVEPILDRGRRVGISVLVYEVATASGSWAVAILFLGFLLMVLAVAVSVVLAKRFTLEPISALRDDVEAVVKGDAPRVPLAQGFSELSEVAKSVNRLIERAPAMATPAPAKRAAPEPPAAPGFSTRQTSVPKLPVAPSPPATSGEGAHFWVDAGFIVVRAEPLAAEILGSSPEAIEGKHVIEAIKDEKVLGAVLDSLNALDDRPGAESKMDTPAGPVSLSSRRDGERVIVSLKPDV
jgi:HAMP domain-containing protein